MYGICHDAAEAYIIEVFGTDMMSTIRADIDLPGDISLHNYYHDEVIGNTFVSLSHHSGVSLDEIFLGFGRFWIKHLKNGPYFDQLPTTTNLGEYFFQINQMHERLIILLPQLKPPYFEILEQTDNTLEIAYYSTRAGLSAMVIGQISALAEQFGKTAIIEHSKKQDLSNNTPDIFKIKLEVFRTQGSMNASA